MIRGNARATLWQVTAIQRDVRLILSSTGLALLCGCGAGGARPESPVENVDSISQSSESATVLLAPPPDAAEVDVLTLRYSLDDPDLATRKDSVERLGDLATEEAVQGLEQALLDPDPDVRAAAIDELADIPGDASAHALSIAVWSVDPSVREDAVDALADVGGSVAIGLLQRALSDEDASIRELAADYLAELNTEAWAKTNRSGD